MPLFWCTYPGCSEVSVLKQGACRLCQNYFCSMHMGTSHHKCPDWKKDKRSMTMFIEGIANAKETEISRLLSLLNVDALRQRAQNLRNVPCSIPPLETLHRDRESYMGGTNFHVPILFSDGVTWLCRIRQRNVYSTPVEHRNLVLLSEVATYKFLQSQTTIPVPYIYGFEVEGPSNPVGMGYILMDKINGRPLDMMTLTEDEVDYILSQLAALNASLHDHPLPKIGCLEDPDDLTKIGPILEESTIDADEDSHLLLLGPYTSARDYREAVVRRQLSHILRGESYINNPTEAYVIHRYIIDSVLPVLEETGPFFLKHMDDKGDHILVDDDLRIVGIIDWEWAQSTTRAEAFAAPVFLLDPEAYYGGENLLTRDEKLLLAHYSRREEGMLAECINRGRLMQRITHCVSGDPGDFSVTKTHFMALMRILRHYPALPVPLEAEIESWEHWKHYLFSRYNDDPDLIQIMHRASYSPQP